jgi:primary-amine oxidase
MHYFDADLVNSKGEPVLLKNAVCMHEEDVGLLWKHVEYRCDKMQHRAADAVLLLTCADACYHAHGLPF